MAINKLSDSSIRAIKPNDKALRLSDGGGLYLLIGTDGSKRWRLDYTFRQKRKTISLGVYPKVTLSQARTAALEAKRNVTGGKDPSELRKREKQGIKLENEQRDRVAKGLPALGSFEDVAREWGKQNVKGWDTESERTKRLLERNIFPYFGGKLMGEVTPAELRDALSRMCVAGILESAHRTLSICGRIFRWGVINDKCSQDITLLLRGFLPQATVKHFATILEPKEVGLLLRAIDGYEGSFIVKCALQIAPMVFVRPGELRSMQWEQVDLNICEWRYLIPKTQTNHIVSLSRQVVAILKQLKTLTGQGVHVFPSLRTPDGNRCISENTLNAALKRLGYSKDQMTSHGFRAMARTLIDEELKIRPDFIEHQLGHTVIDPNGRAYNRTSFLPERVDMMQKYSDYLDKLKSS